MAARAASLRADAVSIWESSSPNRARVRPALRSSFFLISATCLPVAIAYWCQRSTHLAQDSTDAI